ncbi:cysteine desulfurase-like protein [Millisia brevis]|uniref:cysteine desulfurase-like protein n=1 Tax=Millisia brevis TaxID=264148 RepID=UPI000ADF0E5F|nr:cysteine desulfurase-like protein [Millisia brevis]
MTGIEQTIDTTALRAGFGSLSSGIAHFDGPGGTQTPDVVAAAMYAALTAPLANRGRANLAERNADDIVVAYRAALGDFLHVDPATVVFGRSTTELTFLFSRTLAAGWSAGDEIVLSRLDHDANVAPWLIAAQRHGLVVRWISLDPETGELNLDDLDAALGPRTRLVAVTAASNLIGTMPDVPAIAERVHAAGALLYVDGVHYSAHRSVDVPALGADLYACSPYKFLGPHCGALTGRADLLEQLHPDKLRPSTEVVPERFELGTLPYELMAGTTAAIEVLAGLVPGDGTRRERLVRSMSVLAGHEERLRGRIEAAVAAWPEVTVHSRARRRTPTLLLTFAGRDAAEVSARLAAENINAPASSFYALEPSRALGLGDAGGLRVGMSPYNNDEDVDRLLAGLDRILH